MGLQPIFIAGSNAGLQTDKKPFLIPDQAFQVLNNAYIWRERVKKREGLELLGRLRRILTGQALGVTDGAGNFSGNIITIFTLETNSSFEPGTIVVTVGAQVFTEPATPDGTLTNGAGGTGTINYATGDITINTNPNLAATPLTIDFDYYPTLPVMGIWQRELANINQEQTIFFDTKYAYIFSGTGFQEFIPGTTWNASDSDFFWATNYRGITPDIRLFFVTDFINDASNPMRYTDGVTWTTFAPAVDATNFMFQARLLIPYYGRLLALNVYEGTAIGTAVNYFNRCRFSQIGSPVAVDAWRSDQFGKGGFIDAPTNEAIISAAFIKNTLVVFFEETTWQLRYVGEYGLPFLWERVSSDFGSESTFSSVVFDNGLLTVGDKAIISADAVGVRRIDEQIPDQVFEIQNINNGVKRVIGVRDYQRELVFWCFPDEDQDGVFPTQTLVYNYRNNTYAKFRNSVTFFGTFQSSTAITWDSTDVFWDDEDVIWDDDPDDQAQFPRIVSGNQQGFIHYYGYTSQDQPSLSIQAIDSTLTPPQLTIPNHNLQEFDIIYITNVIYSGSTDINDRFYEVHEVIDSDTISVFEWDTDDQSYVNASITSTGTYMGNGQVTLFPKLFVQTKDFNPYQSQGGQFKLSYIDFLTDATPSSAMTVQLFINSSPAVQANLLVGNTQSETSLTPPFYVPASDYAWHRFYATTTGQYVNIVMTYDGDLMNTLATHQQDWILNAMALWMRPGGKVIF